MYISLLWVGLSDKMWLLLNTARLGSSLEYFATLDYGDKLFNG